jgi:thiol:disulfide interchange protein DsbD
MGFLLVGTAVFLIHTLAYQVSRDALVGFLIFLSIFSFALFVYGHWTSPGRSTRTRLTASVIVVALVAFSAHSFVSTERPPAPSGSIMAGGIAWLDFDQVDVNALARDGRTVFIDFTAEWCTTCKVNEESAIYTDRVREALKALDVTPVKADFTVHKPAIAEWLQRFGQPSVPLYVVIPAGRPEAAFALPTLLSVDDVLAGLCKGGASLVTTAGR